MRGTALCLLALTLLASCTGDDDEGGRARRDPTASTSDTLVEADRANLDYDASLPLDATSEPVEREGVPVEHIAYTTFDGTRVPGYFLTDGEPGACLIVQHGAGTSKDDGLVLGGIVRGFGVDVSVLSIDAREHGERRDQPPAAPADAEAWARVVTGTAIDLRRALDYLETRPECDPTRLGLVGVSMGGFTSVLTAAVDQRVRAVVLISTGGDYRLLVTTRGGLYSYLYRNDVAALDAAMPFLDPIDPLRFVGDIASRPLLMINGSNDRLIPASTAEALHDAAGEGSESVWHRGGHSIANHDNDTNTRFFEWLHDHLVNA